VCAFVLTEFDRDVARLIEVADHGQDAQVLLRRTVGENRRDLSPNE